MLPQSAGKVQHGARGSAGCVRGRSFAKVERKRVAERSSACRVAAEEPQASVAIPEVPAETDEKVAFPDVPSDGEEEQKPPPRARTTKTPVGELVVGQTYEGVVKTIASYGCFVDIGAETDGLVHISQLSDGYVRIVDDVVSAGAKVQVKIIEITGKKVSLTMKTGEAPEEGEGRRRRVPNQGRTGNHGLSLNDKVTGEVMRIAGFGAFLKLESGFEVLLPSSEMMADGALDPNPHDLVKVGEKIACTVIKVDGGKVAVSNMSEEDRESLNALEQGVSSETGVEMLGGSLFLDLKSLDLGDLAIPIEAPAPPAADASPLTPEAAAPAVEEVAAPVLEAAAPVEEAAPAAAAVEEAVPVVAEEPVPAVEEMAPVAEEVAPVVEEVAPAAAEEAAPVVAEEPAPVAEEAAPVAEAAVAAAVAISAVTVKELRDASGAGMMACKNALKECGGDVQAAAEWLRKKGLDSADKKAGRIAAEGAVVSYIHAGSRLGVLAEVNCETDFVARGDGFKELASDVAMQIAACADVKVVSPDDVPADVIARERAIELEKDDLKSKPPAIAEKIVEGRINKLCSQQALLSQPFIKSEEGISMEQVLKESIAKMGEKITVRRFVRYEVGEGLEKKSDDFAAEVAAQTEKQEEAPKAEVAKAVEEDEVVEEVPVDAKRVKELRSLSSAGMMDCKKALAVNNNDIEAASVWLKKKGLVSAGKKASRVAAEGMVESYIHAGSSLGVLIELNCETDFVAKGDAFKELAADVAMQVAANPDVVFVSNDDVSDEVKAAELAIESQKEDLLSKPEKVREGIVQGRVNKTLNKMTLLGQDYIKDPSKTVEQVIQETVAKIGENIKVRRFTRFNLGEGIEKKVDDFAAEVAAQTGQVE